jgi:hypothetical protein
MQIKKIVTNAQLVFFDGVLRFKLRKTIKYFLYKKLLYPISEPRFGNQFISLPVEWLYNM